MISVGDNVKIAVNTTVAYHHICKWKKNYILMMVIIKMYCLLSSSWISWILSTDPWRQGALGSRLRNLPRGHTPPITRKHLQNCLSSLQDPEVREPISLVTVVTWHLANCPTYLQMQEKCLMNECLGNNFTLQLCTAFLEGSLRNVVNSGFSCSSLCWSIQSAHNYLFILR